MARVNNEVRADMWRYIQRYAIYTQFMPDVDRLSLVRFTFSRSQGGVTTMSQTDDDDFVSFYYLPWRDDTCFSGRIPRGGANYFFTGPLTGCTFAVDRNWYNPTVAHANWNDPQRRAIDPAHMLQDVRYALRGSTSMFPFRGPGPTITVVESHNRASTWLPANSQTDVSYNVFGYRGYLGWWFMYQVVDRYAPRSAPIAAVSISTFF